MMFGVPMVPFLAVTGVFMLVTMWSFYLLGGYVALTLIAIYIPLVIVMRHITKQDDQRLRQVLMRARMRIPHRGGMSMWGAVSFSPIRYKRRVN